MDKITYTHNNKVLLISCGITFILFILSCFQTYNIGSQHGFNSNSFMIGSLISGFFILDILFIFLFISRQTIEINPKTKEIMLSHINKQSNTKVSISFNDISNIEIIHTKKEQYDIKITLKNGLFFNIFSHGSYLKNDYESIKQQYEKIQNIIFPEKENFL